MEFGNVGLRPPKRALEGDPKGDLSTLELELCLTLSISIGWVRVELQLEGNPPFNPAIELVTYDVLRSRCLYNLKATFAPFEHTRRRFS